MSSRGGVSELKAYFVFSHVSALACAPCFCAHAFPAKKVLECRRLRFFHVCELVPGDSLIYCSSRLFGTHKGCFEGHYGRRFLAHPHSCQPHGLTAHHHKDPRRERRTLNHIKAKAAGAGGLCSAPSTRSGRWTLQSSESHTHARHAPPRGTRRHRRTTAVGAAVPWGTGGAYIPTYFQ